MISAYDAAFGRSLQPRRATCRDCIIHECTLSALICIPALVLNAFTYVKVAYVLPKLRYFELYNLVWTHVSTSKYRE